MMGMSLARRGLGFADSEGGEQCPDAPPFLRLVLTGGPAGGKTSALPILATHLRSRNYRVLTMPEMATYFLSSNGFTFEELGDKKGFQRGLLEMYFACEGVFETVAGEVARNERGQGEEAQGEKRNVLILSDRAAIDASVCKPISPPLPLPTIILCACRH